MEVSLLQEIKSKIFDWFYTNESFIYNRDIEKLLNKKKETINEEENAAVLISLKDLSNEDGDGESLLSIYNPKNDEKQALYLVNFKLSKSSEVEIEEELGQAISETIMNFLSIVNPGNKDYKVDPHEITSNDIYSLLQIIQFLASINATNSVEKKGKKN